MCFESTPPPGGIILTFFFIILYAVKCMKIMVKCKRALINSHKHQYATILVNAMTVSDIFFCLKHTILCIRVHTIENKPIVLPHSASVFSELLFSRAFANQPQTFIVYEYTKVNSRYSFSNYSYYFVKIDQLLHNVLETSFSSI